MQISKPTQAGRPTQAKKPRQAGKPIRGRAHLTLVAPYHSMVRPMGIDLTFKKSSHERAKTKILPPLDSRATVTLILTNSSTREAATDLTVDLRIPEGLSVQDYEASDGRYAGGTWRVGAVPSGGQETLHLSIGVQCRSPRLLRAQLR